MARLSELMAKQGAGDAGPADLRLDGMLMPGAAQIELIEQLEKAGPFGAGAPAPRFAFPDVELKSPNALAKPTLRSALATVLVRASMRFALAHWTRPLVQL